VRAPPSASTGSPRAAGPVTPHPPSAAQLATYRWLAPDASIRELDRSLDPPAGYRRVEVAPGSFGAFLRGLPLRPRGAPVLAHDGRELLAADDPRITAVVELDPGTRDLQQCADTAIRLHAEWLWSRDRPSEIGYHFTSGDLSTWARYAAGDRPKVDGRAVAWSRSAQPSSGHAAFRAYLDQVFTFAGTVSLAREAATIDRADLRVGDVLVLPGGPGHTILILDVAKDDRGRRKALLGQGFMPAQDAHVLASSRNEAWFDLEGDALDTPFWPAPFPWSSLRRLRTANGDTE